MALHVALMIALAAQTPMSGTPQLKDVLEAGRVKDDGYALIMFQLNDDTASNFTLLHRTVENVRISEVPAIRIVEQNKAKGLSTVIDIDARTLRPLSYESRAGDTLVVKAVVRGDSLLLSETRRGVETGRALRISPGAYFSNAFSELLQANDFDRNPAIGFTTFTPGGASNGFLAERIGRKDCSAIQRGTECLVLKFTRIDSDGNASLAGYRYVDSKSGKVLFFTSELDSDTAFTYQVLFMK